jgi:hypothetical protein
LWFRRLPLISAEKPVNHSDALVGFLEILLTGVSGAEDGSIMAGPEGARPPSLDGGEPGDHAGPLISEFSFEVK